MPSEHLFKTRDALLSALTQECSVRLTQAIENKQRASFLVSGGSTPVPLYDVLSTQVLSWKDVDVALVDERWVSVDSEYSNQCLVKNTLLKNKASSANFIGMKTDHHRAVDAQAEVEANYRRISSPFDIVLLGLGLDGHTASLFPEAQMNEHALSLEGEVLCTAVNAKQSKVTGELTQRMSLSLKAITSAKQIILFITGDDKLAVYRQALTADCVIKTPIAAVLQQQCCPVSVYWSP
ncbi:MAG: 6-phosphogluconolactonase [Spongiibacteraceae bacterium]|nr:6-phosphogluconolactonase [Spongiibacteraceae bacterium]